MSSIGADRASADGDQDGVVGVVLCGGSSSRMGTDKSLLGPPGRPLAAHVAHALLDAAVSEVLLVGGDGARLRTTGHPWVADDHPGEGPLGGIATAARLRPGRPLVVCACDLPSVTGPDLVPLVRIVAPSIRPPDALAGEGADGRVDLRQVAAVEVAVFRVDGVAQWSAVAVSATGARAAGEAFGRGERGLGRGLGSGALRVAQLVPAHPAALRDADRPEDLPPPFRGTTGAPG